LRVLVADDDVTIRSELAELLREDGHEVDTAADGAEAIRKLETVGFDVVLLDLVMPRANGLDVLRRARVSTPRTAVIMVTGRATVDAAVEAMKSGAMDFIEKPPELEAIQGALRAVAEEQRARLMLSAPPRIDALSLLLEESAQRNALLAVMGPTGAPPKAAGRVVRISEDARPPDGLTPKQLYQINASVEAHLSGVERPVLYLACLGALVTVHGTEDVRAWVRQVRARCDGARGTLIVAGAPPELRGQIESDLASEEADAGLQGMLESIANPTRRAIVSYVFASGPVAYSAILKRNFVDSSSKLSFHLQKLQADGLLTKAGGGAYALTEDGRRAWRVVRALSEERQHPSVLFAPRG